MDHLDVVAGASLTNPVAAGVTVDLGGGLLEDLFDCGPSGSRATGHERGTMASTLFTTRNTRANKEKTFGLELLGASDRIRVVGVATINDDVTLLEMGHQLGDEIIDGRPSLDEKNDLAGALEFGSKLLDRVGTLDICALSREIR